MVGRVSYPQLAEPTLGTLESAIRGVPDRSVADVGELAGLVGVDKLTLIRWARQDMRFAQLLAAKVFS